jgi:hypothetical protein
MKWAAVQVLQRRETRSCWLIKGAGAHFVGCAALRGVLASEIGPVKRVWRAEGPSDPFHGFKTRRAGQEPYEVRSAGVRLAALF